MSVDPGTLKDGLAAQLRGRIGRDVTVYGWDEYAPATDCVIVRESSEAPVVDYFVTFGPNGPVVTLLEVVVVVGGVDAETRSRKLDDFCSIGVGRSSSIPDGVQSDRTLGHAAADGVDATCLTCVSRSTTGDDGYGHAIFAVQVLHTKTQAEV